MCGNTLGAIALYHVLIQIESTNHGFIVTVKTQQSLLDGLAIANVTIDTDTQVIHNVFDGVSRGPDHKHRFLVSEKFKEL
jgi:hypothetical protein